MTRVRLRSGKLSIEMELRDSATSKALIAALPFDAAAQTWGEEVYFTTPVRVKLEADARQVVEPGTVCFWTQGDALALPFGPTPLSTDARPKLANPCNVLGAIVGDPKQLAAIRPGQKIMMEEA